MTVDSETLRSNYTGNGVTTTFAYNFKILSSSDLKVIKRLIAAPNTETTLILNTDYTVAGVGDDTGSITLVNGAISSAYTLHLLINPEITQDASFRDQARFSASTNEDALDGLLNVSKRLKRGVDASMRLPEGEDPDDFDMTLLPAADRAGKIQAYDADGNPALISVADAGLSVVDFTPTAIPFADAIGTLTDYSGLNWDNVNKILHATGGPKNQFHICMTPGELDGGWLNTTGGSQLSCCGGMYYSGVGGLWVATSADLCAQMLDVGGGEVTIYADVGLTLNGTFTPTRIANFRQSGIDFDDFITKFYGETTFENIVTMNYALTFLGPYMEIGVNPAESGLIRVSNANGIVSRNGTDSGDIVVIYLDSSNVIQLGANTVAQAGLDVTQVMRAMGTSAPSAGAGVEIASTSITSYNRTGSAYTALSIDASALNLNVNSGGDIKWGKALVALGGGAAPTVGTIGGSGPATAGQNSWMQVKDSTGANFWVPAWK